MLVLCEGYIKLRLLQPETKDFVLLQFHFHLSLLHSIIGKVYVNRPIHNMSVCMYVCMICVYICKLCMCLCIYVIYSIHFTDRLVAATHSFNVRKFNMNLIECFVIKKH